MTFYSTLLNQGGPVMPLILVAALAGYVLACERLLVWFRWHWRDRPLLRAPDGASIATGLETAPGLRAATPFRQVLSAALRLRREAPERREPAIHAVVMYWIPMVESRISTIGWLGTILPLLGLLGTVSGMITTFQELSVTTSRQVLSLGLSEALWTTEVGLIGALPLLAVHHLLGRLKARWLNHLERALSLIVILPEAAAGSELDSASESGPGISSGNPT